MRWKLFNTRALNTQSRKHTLASFWWEAFHTFTFNEYYADETVTTGNLRTLLGKTTRIMGKKNIPIKPRQGVKMKAVSFLWVHFFFKKHYKSVLYRYCWIPWHVSSECLVTQQFWWELKMWGFEEQKRLCNYHKGAPGLMLGTSRECIQLMAVTRVYHQSHWCYFSAHFGEFFIFTTSEWGNVLVFLCHIDSTGLCSTSGCKSFYCWLISWAALFFLRNKRNHLCHCSCEPLCCFPNSCFCWPFYSLNSGSKSLLGKVAPTQAVNFSDSPVRHLTLSPRRQKKNKCSLSLSMFPPVPEWITCVEAVCFSSLASVASFSGSHPLVCEESQVGRPLRWA